MALTSLFKMEGLLLFILGLGLLGLYEVMDEGSMLWIAVLLLNLITVLYLASRLKNHALDSETKLQGHEQSA